MIFRLSQKLAKKLKIPLPRPAPADPNPFADWSAHLFAADTTQYPASSPASKLTRSAGYWAAGCHGSDESSITQPLRRLSQLLPIPLRVPARGLQILVPQDLSQRNQIVPVVSQELLRHRVPKNMRM